MSRLHSRFGSYNEPISGLIGSGSIKPNLMINSVFYPVAPTGKSMKNITFYSRFENDILAGRKTITLREASDAQFDAGDSVRVSRYEDEVFFCTIEVLAVTPVQFSELNQRHADQENMTLMALKQVISEIYPGLNELFMIEFRLI